MRDSNLYAHPDELLEDHLLRVNESALTTLNGYQSCFDSSDLYVDFKTAVDIVTKLHDIGKATEFFQRYLNNEDVHAQKKSHSLISALVALFYIKSSKIVFKNANFDFFAYLVIKRHHGNFLSMRKEKTIFLDQKDLIIEQIDNIDRTNFSILCENVGIQLELNEFKEFILKDLDNVKREFRQFVRSLSKEKNIASYVYLNILFSLLLSADKVQTAMPDREQREKVDIPNNIVDVYKDIEFKDANKSNEINIIREKIYQCSLNSIKNQCDKKLFSLNVPTGTGKTLAVYSTVIHLRNQIQREKGYTPKVIYTLPFITIIDQNSEVFENVLKVSINREVTSDILLRHHSLSHIRYTGQDDLTTDEINDDNSQISKSQLLTELWESEFVFTTFVQLFNTLFSNKNRVLKRFHSLIGSIIVLDEAQGIPRKYWDLVQRMLIFLNEEFNTRVILMTATLPLIFTEDKMTELVQRKEHFFHSLSRINLLYDLKEKKFSDFKSDVVNDLDPPKSYLFVLNTIKSSQDLFSFLDNRKIKSQFNIYYLSTRIIPKHRLRRIKEIKRRLESKKGEKGVIVISTQLIEAGVDLDFDIVYRDFAPLDSINQTGGRCNRHNKYGKRGIVHVLNLLDDIDKDNKLKLRRFCDYIYDEVLLDATFETLKEFDYIIPEKEFYELSKIYFEKVYKRVTSEDQWLKSISSLNYHSNNKFSVSRFSLIPEQSYQTVDLFIIPERKDRKEASGLWQMWEDLEYFKGFERRLEFQKFKHKFAEYRVSVPTTPELISSLNLSPDQSLAKWDVKEMQVATNFKYDELIGFYSDKEDSQNVI